MLWVSPGWTRIWICEFQGSPFFHDAIEAHSCVDPLMPNSFLSKTQLVMINQLQDVSTQRSLSTAYRMYAVDKDLRVKTSCSWFIITSCVLLKKEFGTIFPCCIIQYLTTAIPDWLYIINWCYKEYGHLIVLLSVCMCFKIVWFQLFLYSCSHSSCYMYLSQWLYTTI